MSTTSPGKVTRIENAIVWTGRQIPGTADYAVTDAIAFVGDRVLALGQAARSMAADHVIDAEGGFICHAFGDGHVHSIFGGLEQQFAPKLSSRKLEDGSMVTSPLEDMAPFLSREELAGNMIAGVKEQT